MDGSPVELIVRRPDLGERELLEEATLVVDGGLLGDNWVTRPSSATADGSPHPGKQVTLMNTRVIELFAGPRERWPLAGDQFFADLDLSLANLPAGTHLSLGGAVIEVSPDPHSGCVKFAERFGMAALEFVSSQTGKQLRLRGLNARVVKPGLVHLGDRLTKV